LKNLQIIKKHQGRIPLLTHSKTSHIALKNIIQTVEEKYKGMTRNDVQSTLEKLSKR